jgi:hypothetical protein
MAEPNEPHFGSTAPDAGSASGAPTEIERRTSSAWREWMMVAVGLTSVLSVLGLIVSLVALSSKTTTTPTATEAAYVTPAATVSVSQKR